MIYRTIDGDVLDELCGRHYGDRPWSLDTVLAANRGLAAIGAVMPSGVLITFPDPEPAPPDAQHVRLWT
jgi:phage tail protein X